MDRRPPNQIRVLLATTNVRKLIIFPAAEIGDRVRLRLDSLPEPEWLCRIVAGLASLLNKEVMP